MLALGRRASSIAPAWSARPSPCVSTPSSPPRGQRSPLSSRYANLTDLANYLARRRPAFANWLLCFAMVAPCHHSRRLYPRHYRLSRRRQGLSLRHLKIRKDPLTCTASTSASPNIPSATRSNPRSFSSQPLTRSSRSASHTSSICAASGSSPVIAEAEKLAAVRRSFTLCTLALSRAIRVPVHRKRHGPLQNHLLGDGTAR